MPKSLTSVSIASATLKYDFPPLENALVTVLKNELGMISLLPPWTFNGNIAEAFWGLPPYKFILVRSTHGSGSRSEMQEWKWKENQVLTFARGIQCEGDDPRQARSPRGSVAGAPAAPFSVLPSSRYCKAEQMRVRRTFILLPCLGFAAIHTPQHHNKSTWYLKTGDGRLQINADWFDLGHIRQSYCLRRHSTRIWVWNKAFQSGQRHGVKSATLVPGNLNWKCWLQRAFWKTGLQSQEDLKRQWHLHANICSVKARGSLFWTQ